jgi:hypothetical protein
MFFLLTEEQTKLERLSFAGFFGIFQYLKDGQALTSVLTQM